MKRWLIVLEYKMRLRMAAYLNYRNGYACSPIKRCAECKHTTPHHYQWCTKPGAGLIRGWR